MPDDNQQQQQQTDTGNQQQQQQQPAFSTMAEGPVRDMMTAKAYDSYDKVATAYYNLARLHSGAGDIVELPGENATPEQLKAFYQKVNNAPTDPNAYEIKIADGIEVNQEFLAAAKGWFVEAGIRPDQAQLLADRNNEFVVKALGKVAEAQKAANDTAVAQLKQKYDSQGKGAWDQAVANGQKAVKALGLTGEQLARLDAANGVAANLELLVILGERLGEARNLDGEGNNGFGSPEQARVEIARLQNDKAFQDSLLDVRDPMHAVNSRKWSDLQKVAYGKSGQK
jgi:hypothetical protein